MSTRRLAARPSAREFEDLLGLARTRTFLRMSPIADLAPAGGQDEERKRDEARMAEARRKANGG